MICVMHVGWYPLILRHKFKGERLARRGGMWHGVPLERAWVPATKYHNDQFLSGLTSMVALQWGGNSPKWRHGHVL